MNLFVHPGDTRPHRGNSASELTPFNGVVIFFATCCHNGSGCCAGLDITVPGGMDPHDIVEAEGRRLWMGVDSQPVTVVDGQPQWPEGTTEDNFTPLEWLEED